MRPGALPLLLRWALPDRWDVMNNRSLWDWMLAAHCYLSRRRYVLHTALSHNQRDPAHAGIQAG